MRSILTLTALLPVLAFGQTAAAQQTFPGLGNYNIGGPQDYDNPAVMAKMAVDDVYIVAGYDGWQNGRALTLPQIEAQVATATVRNTKIINYFDPIYLGNASPAFAAQMNTANWWLRCPSLIGPIAVFGGVGTGDTADVYPGGPTGVGGRNYVQYDADYTVDYMYNGGAAGLESSTNAANSALSGVFMDDLQFQIGIIADWARTGTCAAGSFGSGTNAGMQSAFLGIAQRIRADKPGALVIANLSQASYLPVPSAYVGQFDGGVLEGIVGGTGSIEQFGLDASAGVAAYQNEMSLVNSNNYGIFEAVDTTPNGEDQVNTTVPYQAMRHNLAFCLVVGNARCALDPPAGGNPDLGAALWFDEEAVNTTTQAPGCSAPGTSCNPYLGYLGTAVDPPQTAAYQGCYWRRRFQYGEVWWSPRQCPAGTINFGYTVNFIQGAQAPTFNTGGSGTTHPISSRDGIIVLHPTSGSSSSTATVPTAPSDVSIKVH